MPAKINGLTPKQLRFVELYCDHSSKTFGNALKSYLAAGYKNGTSLSQNSSRLLANDKISKAVSNYRQKIDRIEVKKVEINAEYARQALLETYEQAKKLKDTTNQVACCRLLLQTTGQLSDKMVIDVQGAIQLEERHQHAAKRIASIMVREKLLDAGADDDGTQDVVVMVDEAPAIIDAESISIEDTEIYDE